MSYQSCNPMNILIRILGVLVAALGLMVLVPSAILLNQRLRLVRMSWGVFDIQVGAVAMSNTAAGVILGIVGMMLFVSGILLVRRHYE